MFDMANSNLGDARIWDRSYVQVSGMKLGTLTLLQTIIFTNCQEEKDQTFAIPLQS